MAKSQTTNHDLLSQHHGPTSRQGSGDTTLALCTAGELFGGVERHVLDLCRYARGRSGVSPILVLFYDGELATRARTIGVETVVLSGAHRYDPRAAVQLADHLLQRGVRILHTHGYKATIVGAVAKGRSRQFARASNQAKFGLVKTEHGLTEPARNGFDWSKMHLYGALDCLATYLAADTVCFVTADLQRRKNPFCRRREPHVIHNGIEPLERRMFTRPSELPTGLVHFGIVGRLAAIKGISVALRALRSPDMPAIVQLSIIGDGPSEGDLRREVASLGIAKQVQFLGFRANIHDYMANLDGLVIPSLHEGLPYVLLEAMSLGLPIIASDVGGLAEVLRHGHTGVLVPRLDVGALSTAMRDVACRREWALALGAEAAKEQRKSYTLDAMGSAYWDLYEAPSQGVCTNAG